MNLKATPKKWEQSEANEPNNHTETTSNDLKTQSNCLKVKYIQTKTQDKTTKQPFTTLNWFGGSVGIVILWL